MSARSEQIIATDDREVKILFTNRALATAEKSLGKSVIGVAQGFANGGSGITEIAILLQVGMDEYRRDARLGGSAVTINDAYAVMDEVGFSETANVVMNAIAQVIGYSKNSKN